MANETETDWAAKIGKPTADGLREMVAALECDYDRLEELRDARDSFEMDPEDAEELADLLEAAGDCESREQADERIQEDPLSIEVRSGWVTPGSEMEAEEFMILLSTGGPAVRIVGELDEHGEPHRAWLEVQDWFKPWTEYHEPGLSDVLLTYARCFSFSC